eukprot:927094-Pyramimonas_sp.AAC.1
MPASFMCGSVVPPSVSAVGGPCPDRSPSPVPSPVVVTSSRHGVDFLLFCVGGPWAVCLFLFWRVVASLPIAPS